MEDTFESLFDSLDPDTKQVLLAALWAGMDVHAPLDNLTASQWERLEHLANYVNTRLS
jgi:hypothetical protein